MSQSKQRLIELNARLAQNLTDKGVKVTVDETTTTLVNKVVDISSPKEEQEKTIEITQNGTTEILPDESKTLSKVNVEVDVTNTYYDMFWDAHLLPEKRGGAFAYAFYNWFDEMFYPKHDIVAKGNCACMFQYIKITDMVERLNECKARLDTSGAENLTHAFANTQITHLPHISFLNGTTITLAFHASKKLQLIDKITIKPSLSFSDAFNACENLTTISEVEGEFGKNLNMSSCSKLDNLTIDNIINAYADMTGQTAPILTVHPDVKAKIEANETWLNTLINKNVTLA